jgi:hypothetical protein
MNKDFEAMEHQSRAELLGDMATDAFDELHGEGYAGLSDTQHVFVLKAIMFGVQFACEAMGQTQTYEEEYQALLRKMRAGREVNRQVMAIVREAYCLMVSEKKVGREVNDERRRINAALEGKVDAELCFEIDNLVGDAIIAYGNAMFDYGLEFGRDPAKVLTLREVP